MHPEVEVSVSVTVARSADEAERIKRGEDISTRQEDQDAAAEAIAAAGEFFDPEAQHDDEQPAAGEARPRSKRAPRFDERSLQARPSFRPGLSFSRRYASSSSIAIEASAVAVCFSTPSVTQNTSAATTAT